MKSVCGNKNTCITTNVKLIAIPLLSLCLLLSGVFAVGLKNKSTVTVVQAQQLQSQIYTDENIDTQYQDIEDYKIYSGTLNTQTITLLLRNNDKLSFNIPIYMDWRSGGGFTVNTLFGASFTNSIANLKLNGSTSGIPRFELSMVENGSGEGFVKRFGGTFIFADQTRIGMIVAMTNGNKNGSKTLLTAFTKNDIPANNGTQSEWYMPGGGKTDPKERAIEGAEKDFYADIAWNY